LENTVKNGQKKMSRGVRAKTRHPRKWRTASEKKFWANVKKKGGKNFCKGGEKK